jgi:hypothetical protein
MQSKYADVKPRNFCGPPGFPQAPSSISFLVKLDRCDDAEHDENRQYDKSRNNERGLSASAPAAAA